MAALKDTLVSLVDYDAWATHRVLDAAARLTNEQFNAAAGAPERTVRQLLIHPLGTMAFWRAMLLGQERPDTSGGGLDDVAAIRAWSDGLRDDYRAWVAGLSAADLDRAFVTRMGARTWSEMLVQVAQHAIHHRGEVASLLTAYGQSPGDLDYLFSLRDRDASG